MKLYRQGDVMFIARKIPAGERKVRESGIVAYGEVTGHAHRVEVTEGVEVFGCGDGLYVTVRDGNVGIVGHEEHGTIMLPPGEYEVRIQREYHPEAIRNVLD